MELFKVLCLGGWGYALLRGGGPERVGSWILIVGLILSIMALPAHGIGFVDVEPAMLLVDTLILIAFAGLAVATREMRKWPIWMTSLQIAVVLFHFPILIRPLVTPEGYAIAIQFWPWPMMLLLIGATWTHQRRLRRNGNDPSWRLSSDR